MDRPQLIRRLRIAVSVFFAVVTVALCVLWVRSQTTIDSMFGPITSERQVVVTARHGGIGVGTNLTRTSEFRWVELEASGVKSPEPNMALAGFEAFWPPKHYLHAVRVPFWFLVSVSATLAALSLRPITWHFSLRTLLIVTTIVAIVLGLGVWAAG